jgi:translation elongation factor EF-G
MSTTFHRRILKTELAKLVPGNLRHLATGITAPEPYAVAVFAVRPVRVGQLKRALKKLGTLDGEHPVVAAVDFTQEARALASAHGAYVLEQSHFGWTEKSYEDIRTRIATNKK